MRIEQAWENDRSSFTEIPKVEFDVMVREGSFESGPLRTELSAFMREFGPYSPERWAFGQLADGRRVCAKIQ